MAIRLPRIIHAKKTSQQSSNSPKGCIAVYVGDDKKRFFIPISFLNHPLFHDLLNQAEEEFGFDHPTGGLTLPCRVDFFLDLTSRLNRS